MTLAFGFSLLSGVGFAEDSWTYGLYLKMRYLHLWQRQASPDSCELQLYNWSKSVLVRLTLARLSRSEGRDVNWGTTTWDSAHFDQIFRSLDHFGWKISNFSYVVIGTTAAGNKLFPGTCIAPVPLLSSLLAKQLRLLYIRSPSSRDVTEPKYLCLLMITYGALEKTC